MEHPIKRLLLLNARQEPFLPLAPENEADEGGAGEGTDTLADM